MTDFKPRSKSCPHTVKQQATGQRPAQTQCILLCVFVKIRSFGKAHICFSFSIKKTPCVDAGITRRSAINSTFVRQKTDKRTGSLPALFFCVELCFSRLRNQEAAEKARTVDFLLGSRVEPGGPRGWNGERTGGEVNASALPCNNHEGLLTRLPCYWLLVAGILSLRLTDGGRRGGGGLRDSRDAGRRGRARGGEGQRSLATALRMAWRMKEGFWAERRRCLPVSPSGAGADEKWRSHLVPFPG